jgi:hypothetical protein
MIQSFRLNAISICVAIAALIQANASWAASEEIQVYSDDKEEPGQTSVDFHSNYVTHSRRTPEYLGEQAPNGVFRLTPEFNLGLTDTLEFGAYLLTTRSSSGEWNAQGYKFRLKYIAPHESEGFYWGLNLETGKQNLAVSPTPYNSELKTIFGWNSSKWNYAINFNTAGSSNSGSEPLSEDIDFKINYTYSQGTQLGIESYNEMGPLRSFQGLSSNSKTLFAVIDTEVAGHELNAGIGRGLNANSDQWIFKFIVNTRF